MDNLPSVLRQARESRGLTRTELAERTKLKEHYIAALENGEVEKLPSPVYARAFLRLCARELELDPTELLNEYDSLAVSSHEAPTQAVEGNRTVHPYVWRWVLVAGLLVSVALGRWLIPRHSPGTAEPNTHIDVPEPSPQVPLIIPEGMADTDNSNALQAPFTPPAPEVPQATAQTPQVTPTNPVQASKTLVTKPVEVTQPSPEVKPAPIQVAPQVVKTPPVTEPEAPQAENTALPEQPQPHAAAQDPTAPLPAPVSPATPAAEAANDTNAVPVADGTAIFYPGRTGSSSTATNP